MSILFLGSTFRQSKGYFHDYTANAASCRPFQPTVLRRDRRAGQGDSRNCASGRPYIESECDCRSWGKNGGRCTVRTVSRYQGVPGSTPRTSDEKKGKT